MLKLQCNGDLECLDEEDEEDCQENADKVLLNETTTNRLNGRNSTGSTNCTVIDSFETIEEIGSICGSNGHSGRNEILEKSFNEISPKLDDTTTTRGRLRGNGDGRNLLARFKEDILSRFEFQVFLAWFVLCVPGIVVTLILCTAKPALTSEDVEKSSKHNNSSLSLQGLQCHELRKDWQSIVSMSQFIIQGISVTIIGIFGFAGNILSVIVLLQCRDNRNFHLLLVGLAVIDTLLIVDLIIEVSIVGVFMQKEPKWYIITYPYIFHPIRGIIQTAAIFMVVAVTTERYRAMCQPMAHRHAYYKYITIAVILAASLEFPRFFEMKLEDGNGTWGVTQYWTTDLMENPIYVQFNSYWIDIFATGLVPLLFLCYMNMKIFFRIKASSQYALRFVSHQVPSQLTRNNTLSSNSRSNLSRRLSRTQKLSTGSLVNGEDASVTTAIELQNHQAVMVTFGIPLGTGARLEVLHQDQECQDHEVIEEEEAQDEEDVPSLNRTVSANSSSFAHIEYANRGGRMQRTKSGAQYVRRRQEKSTAIIVAIIVVFFVCHVFRLSFRIYEMALPESSVYDHYKHCDSQGKYHVPVIIYFLTHIHTLFLDINSSINFVIYCFMGRHFRQQLKKLASKFW